MNLKTKDNSADVSCSEDILNTTESLPNKDKDWQFYLILIEKTNRPFQSPQDHTNNRINRRIFLDWIRDKQYISLFEDKKNREGFSFASAALPPAFDKHPNLPISEEFPNWTENFLELESNKRLQLVSNETIKRIKEFKLLKEGWDSYNAKPIKWATIIRAIDFFTKVISKHHNAPLPFVAPVCDGRIHFEWKICAKILMNLIPESINEPFEYLKIDKSSGQINKTSGKVINMDGMLEIIFDWMQ